MAYTYNINTSKKDNVSSFSMMIVHRLHGIINLFFNTFLVAHIYELSSDIFSYIHNVAIYFFYTYLIFFATLIVVTYFVEKSNRVIFYRIGIMVRTALVIFIVFYGKQIAGLLPLAGVLSGLSLSAYYGAFNVIQNEMVSRKSLKSYFVTSLVLSRVFDIIIPITFGALIEASTYSQVAIYVAILCVILLLISLFIRAKKPDGSSFKYFDYFKRLRKNKFFLNKMRIVYFMTFIYGFTTVVEVLVNISVMQQFESNFSLGMLTSIFSFISIISILLFNKFTKAGKREIVYGFIAVIPVLSTFIFAVCPTVTALIIYNVGVAISKIIMETYFELYRTSNLKDAGFYDCIAEHQVTIENIMQISRIISFVIMLVLGFSKSIIAFRIFMCIFTLSYSGVVAFLIYYERKYFKNPNALEEHNFKIIMSCIKKDL